MDDRTVSSSSAASPLVFVPPPWGGGAGFFCAPGTGFGEFGEVFVRFALVEDVKRLALAVKRIEPVLRMKS